MSQKEKIPMSWNLDSIFPGGSSSPEFKAFLGRLQQGVDGFLQKLGAGEAGAPRSERGPDKGRAADEGRTFAQNDSNRLRELVEDMQSLVQQVKEAEAYTDCLTSQDVKDKAAVQLSGRVKMLQAELMSSLTRFDQVLTGIPQPQWEKLLQSAEFKGISFPLNERRSLALEKMRPELEALAASLAVDGYHGWGELYQTAVGNIRIPFEGESLSAGQAANKLTDPDRAVRSALFEQWEKAWANQADYCADALNHLGGFRLQLYKNRGWKSVHKEPLAMNRMSEQTLQVMWDVIQRSKPIFVQYLNRKAQLLGLERLSWYDVEAPIGSASTTISYSEAASTIVEQFRKFSPRMADFAVKTFEDGWIEAEDRPGKRPGGFCTSFPLSEQTRIFMTYAGTPSNVSTLAHELGHAFHQHVMNDMPGLAQDYAMNVAETASTFAEMLVSDAAVKKAQNEEERLILLEDKIQRSVAFYMNIHARFLFETRFYEARSSGIVDAAELNHLMEQAQREAFLDSLSEYHPHFWASKLHFYLTDVPFYNFPYTFGYLFSAGIYARAQAEGSGFESRYVDLLRDTGSMSVEELAQKHLGVDLTRPDFWSDAIELTVQDVKRFLQWTEPAGKA